MASIDSVLSSGSSADNMISCPAAMLGLIGFYNTRICGIESRAVLPYC